MLRKISCALVVAAACGGASVTAPGPGPTPPPTPTPPPVAAPLPTPPALRLDPKIHPTEYALDLTVDPDADHFGGAIVIQTALDAPTTDVIWLSASPDLKIDTATIDGRPAKVIPGDKNVVGVLPASPLPAGHVELRLAWTGAISEKDHEGLFREKDSERWYAFTQLEEISARKVFPCFDEPSFKVPWQLTLHVPKGQLAVSNTPIAETKEDGDKQTIAFEKTKPLPSYLVAFAVGPFEIFDAGVTKRSKVRLRLIAPRGHADETHYAVSTMVELLDRLEEYFGTPFPYPKLDVVAVPRFPGAMENAGLITDTFDALLAKDADWTVHHRISYATVIAHEMAHQWFGDLVTLGWWNDVWLNEAFATWMETKIVAGWKPEWQIPVDEVSSRSGAMYQDSLVTARRIRQPIESNDDIENAFDGITYEKGAAVLRMFETWVGPEAFRKGVQAYLAAHAWKSATSADFLAALGEAAGHDVATPFYTFLDQVGVPLVHMELACDGGKPRLELSQERFLPIGSEGNRDQIWQVPVCVAWGGKKASGQKCALLTEAKTEWTLGDSCPEWIDPNVDGRGYYRAQLDRPQIDALLAVQAKLQTTSRVAFLGDLSSLGAANKVPLGTALAAAVRLADDPAWQVLELGAGVLWSLDTYVPDDLRPKYAKLIQRLYGARARELGLLPKPNEAPSAKQLRGMLIQLVAGPGKDDKLAAEATRLMYKWLDDRTAVPKEMQGTVQTLAARHGDRKLFDRVRAEAKKATDPRERGVLLGTLGEFTDLRLAEEARALTIGDEFERQESIGILFQQLGSRETREGDYEFMKAHFDELTAKLPRQYGAFFIASAGAFCNAEKLADAQKFYQPKAADLPGGQHMYDQVTEGTKLCVATRNAQLPGIIEFLKKI